MRERDGGKEKIRAAFGKVPETRYRSKRGDRVGHDARNGVSAFVTVAVFGLTADSNDRVIDRCQR